jgi:hypothetical protein
MTHACKGRILEVVPDESPDPDCGACHGDGAPQSRAHQFLADDWSNKACPHCWAEDTEGKRT